MSKAKVSDILSEIFKKIGSKENTKEVSSMKHFKITLTHFFSAKFKRHVLQMCLNLQTDKGLDIRDPGNHEVMD